MSFICEPSSHVLFRRFSQMAERVAGEPDSQTLAQMLRKMLDQKAGDSFVRVNSVPRAFRQEPENDSGLSDAQEVRATPDIRAILQDAPLSFDYSASPPHYTDMIRSDSVVKQSLDDDASLEAIVRLSQFSNIILDQPTRSAYFSFLLERARQHPFSMHVLLPTSPSGSNEPIQSF